MASRYKFISYEKRKIMTELTKEQWAEVLSKQDEWNRKHFLCACALFGVPQKMLDVGCGTGAMVKIARMLGSEAYGVDMHKHQNVGWLYSHDLTTSFSMAEKNLPSQYPMVVSIEVAEHIPKSKHDVFCDTIANHLMTQGILIFTSAVPGQGGEEHVGCEQPTYWRTKFHNRGIGYRADMTSMLAMHWSNILSPLMWLPPNLQVFQR